MPMCGHVHLSIFGYTVCEWVCIFSSVSVFSINQRYINGALGVWGWWMCVVLPFLWARCVMNTTLFLQHLGWLITNKGHLTCKGASLLTMQHRFIDEIMHRVQKNTTVLSCVVVKLSLHALQNKANRFINNCYCSRNSLHIFIENMWGLCLLLHL